MAYLDAFEKPSAQPETKRTSYLDAFEKGANTAPKNLEPEHPYLDIAKDIGIKAAQGTVDLGQSAVGLGSLATGGLFGKGMRAIGYDPQTTNAMLGEHLSDQQKAADAAVANADGVGDTVSAALHNPRAIAGAIAESAPSMLGGMGVTRAAASGIAKRAGIGLGAAEAAQAGNAAVQQAAGKLATIGAATEGVQAAGTIADNAQAQGKDYTDYALPAVGAGLGTAAIGKVGSKLAGDIGTDIASGTHTVKGGYAARVAKAALTDSAEEASQSAQEQAFTNKAMGEQDLTKGVGNAAGMGAVTGGVMGGGMASTQVTPKPNSPLSNAAETAQANGAAEQLTTPEQPLEEAAPNPLAEHLDNSANKNQWVAQSFNQAHDLKQQLAEQEGLRAKDFKVLPISNSDGSKQFIVQRVNQIVPQVNNQDASLPLQNEAQPQQTQPAEPSPTQHPPEQMQNRDRSGIYSVIQMQKIAKKPDYDRMGVGNSMDESAPMVSVKNDIQSIAPQHMGNEGVTTFPDGTKVPFRYAVVPADSVQTSHDASGNANHTYNDPQDGQLVALNNGRTAGLKQAYQQGTAQDYQSKLQQDTRHGIDPVTVENTPNPMLIKVYSDEANKQIPNIGAQSNSRPNLGLSTIEQAKTDAAALPDDAVWGANHTDLTHASNQDFIRHTLSNMVPDNERSQLLDAGGQLTQQGLKRMQSALTMKAYDAPDIIKDNFEATDPEIKSIGNALTDVSPQVLQVKEAVKSGHVAPEWDIAPAVAKAAQIVRQAKAEDKPVMQLVANNQLDPADNVSPETKAVLGLMFKDGQYTKQASGKELATKLRQYTQSAIKSQNADIFSDNQTPAETLAKLSNIGEKNEATTVGTGTPENSLAYRSERNKWNGAEQTSPATQDQVQGSAQAVGNGANNKGEMNDHAIDKTREPDIHQEQPDIAAVERKNLSTAARFMQNAHTKQSLTKTIKQTMDNTYGKGWSSRLAETGKFKVIDRIQAEKIAGIKPSKKSVAQAFYMPSNKTTYLIADNIRQQDDIKALMLHEIGVHALTLGREDAVFKEILKQVESMKETNPKIKAAFGRVPTGTNPYHVAEEAVAYLVQDHPNLPVVQKLLAVFRKFVRKVGLSLGINERMKFFQWADKLNDTDLIHMASSALKSAPKRLSRDDMNATGRENLGIKLSAFPNPNQNIIPGTPTTEGLDRFPPVSNGRPPSQNSLPESQPAGQRSLPAETHAQRNQRLLQDSDNRFKVAQDYVKKNGGTVTEANDMYHAMERMPGRVAAQMEDFQRNTVDKLLQRMAKGNFEKNDVALYLYAIHAPERNAAIAKINPRFQDGGSGMMNQEADDTIKEIKSHYGVRFGEFKKVAEGFQGITDKTLDMLVSSGSISQGDALAYRTAYSDYVPLKGFEKLDEGGKHGAGTGIGHSTNRNFSKRALGRSSKAGQILENIIRDHDRAVIFAEKAKVGRVVQKFIDDNQDFDIGTVNKIPQMQVYSKSPPPNGMVTLRAAQFDPEKEIQFLHNGELVRIQLKDPLMLRAYNTLGATGVSDVMKVGASVNRVLRQFWTAKNPSFFFINPIRDLQQLGVVMTGEGGVSLAAKSYGHWGGAWKAMLHQSRNTDAGQWQTWVDRYRNAGGSTGAAYVGSIEQQVEKLDNQLKRLGVGSAFNMLAQGNVMDAAKMAAFKTFNNSLFDMIESLNSAFEGATRLAAFRASVESGMSDNEAGRIAKNVSVNFNRHGEWGHNLGAAYLFANANIQGTANLYRTLMSSENKGQAWGLVGSLAIAGFMSGMMADDDDDELIPDYEKERNLVIGIGDGKRVNIPLAYGWSYFRDVGRAMADFAKGKKDPMKIGVGLASSFLGNFSPVGNPIAGGKLGLTNAVVQLAPTAAKPLITSATNINSFGSAMLPESPFKKNQPDSEKAFRKTKGTGYDMVAKGLNHLTGGDIAKSGWIDVSPETMKATIGFITGGAGRFLSDSTSTGMSVFSPDDPLKPETWPILKSFYKTESIDDHRRKFYEQSAEVSKAHEMQSTYRNAKDFDALQAFNVENGKLAGLNHRLTNVSKQIKLTRDKQDEFQADDSLDPSVKRDVIDKLEKHEQYLLQRFDKAYRDVAG